MELGDNDRKKMREVIYNVNSMQIGEKISDDFLVKIKDQHDHNQNGRAEVGDIVLS